MSLCVCVCADYCPKHFDQILKQKMGVFFSLLSVNIGAQLLHKTVKSSAVTPSYIKFDRMVE